jgi:membrane protein DedA with SNARE-associated domain/membrane-associated phospholipid phosphatase
VSFGQIVAAIAGVLIAIFVVWRRDRLSGERKLLAGALVLACGVYASGAPSALPDPKKLIEDIAQALGAWTYVLVGVMAFLETGAFIGLVAPGETVVIAGGVIAGQGEIQLIPLIGLVWACAVLGDTTSFYLGSRLGRGFLEQHGPRFKITHERLEQVDRYFERHGGKTILIGRFIGLVRAIAPFVAGSSQMAYRSFIPYSIVGTGLWAATFCVLGYVFWRSFDQVASIAGQAILGFGLTVAVVVGIVLAYRRREQIGDWLVDHEAHPLLRPLFAVARPLQRRVIRPIAQLLAPEARFLGERLTPGGLGLELTTTLAVGLVGLYVFVLYTVELSGNVGPTPLDQELLDVADQLRVGAGVTAAEIVSGFGSFPACAALVIVTAGVAIVQRRPDELVPLVLGFALIYLAVHLGKAGIDRPRPANPLIDTRGSAFPSGHAAYATAWLAAALVFTRRLGLAGVALVSAAVVLVAAVGLSRIYLRAHYWSDVAAGWGIGVGIFGLLAAIAMIVEHIRHNGEEPEQRQDQPAVAGGER